MGSRSTTSPTGKLLVDKVGDQYGKDGYGIAVDEERQRVFVANRDHRLNPPGEETDPVAVTVSRRVVPETPGLRRARQPGVGRDADGAAAGRGGVLAGAGHAVPG